MRNENLTDNIHILCSDCASKPNPIFFEMPLEFFLGKFVKLGVPTDDTKLEKEHLWFKVTSLYRHSIERATITRHDGDSDGDNEDEEELIGLLWNRPILIDMNHGDKMAFKRTEIEDVTETSD